MLEQTWIRSRGEARGPSPLIPEQAAESRQEPGMRSEREPARVWLVLSPDRHWAKVWVRVQARARERPVPLERVLTAEPVWASMRAQALLTSAARPLWASSTGFQRVR